MSAELNKRSDHRYVRSLTIGLFVLAIGLVGFLAGRVTWNASPTEPEAAEPATVVVAEGTLVDQARFNIAASWAERSRLGNRLAGTVTRVGLPSPATSVVEPGTVLYWIDELPMIAIPGEVPAYRDLGPGSSGADVTQVQQFLKAEDVYPEKIDGVWGEAVSRALNEWQERAGLPPTNGLALGTVAFLPTMPARVGALENLTPGAHLDDGAPVIAVLEPLPTLSLVLPGDLDRSLDGATVGADIGGTRLDLVAAGDFRESETGEPLAALRGRDPLQCADWCDELPLDGTFRTLADVTFAGPASGALVPTGVLQSGTDGDFVRTATGETVPVEVQIQVDGQAIVTGVAAGDVVQVPGTGGE